MAKLEYYCAYQDRCQKEVEEKMKSFNLIPEAEEKIWISLIQNNFINEERFVRSFCRGKFYQKKWGKQKIIQHLKLKNIPPKLIETGLQEIDNQDYEDTFSILAEKKWSQIMESNLWKKKQRLVQYFYQKGYENHLIYSFINDKND